MIGQSPLHQHRKESMPKRGRMFRIPPEVMNRIRALRAQRQPLQNHTRVGHIDKSEMRRGIGHRSKRPKDVEPIDLNARAQSIQGELEIKPQVGIDGSLRGKRDERCPVQPSRRKLPYVD